MSRVTYARGPVYLSERGRACVCMCVSECVCACVGGWIGVCAIQFQFGWENR